MITPVKFFASAAFCCGLAALAPSPAAALPVATAGVDATPATEQVHAVRVCGPRGCYWSHAHRHGWRRHPHWGWRPYRHGWRHHHHWR